MSKIVGALLCLAAIVAASPAPAADKIVAAGNRLSAIAPLYIGRDKGLFTKEGLDVSLVHLTSATEIGAAIASNSAQYGMTAFSAGIYTLAGKGALKVIAGGYEEFPGYHGGVALVVNKGAYERGLRTPADLKGKRIAITTVGSGSHNQLARIAKKYGFKFEEMTIVPVQTLSNEVSAVKGGQVDASPIPATLAKQVEQSGDGKIIAWMGDEVPTQFGGVFASPTTVANRDMTTRFLRGYVNAIQLYDRAFQHKGPDGNIIKGEGYDELVDIITKGTGESKASLEASFPYFDRNARLQVDDIAEQIEVYKALRLVDQNLRVETVVDRSFIPLDKK